MISQHSCIIPHKQKGQKYPTIFFPPTSSQHLPRYKSDKGMDNTVQGQHFAINSMGSLTFKTTELHNDECLSLFSTFSGGKLKQKIIAGNHRFLEMEVPSSSSSQILCLTGKQCHRGEGEAELAGRRLFQGSGSLKLAWDNERKYMCLG